MIIPIECFTCNNPWLASRWEMYIQKVKEYRKAEGKKDEMEYLTATTTKTAEGKALDDLKLTRQCCRRHMLSHVDLI
jgi:DNA-directed RNA polymerase I, II, and III subunit RPABC5